MAMSKAAKLPEEIIIDILSLLPAKFIGQYRCVSKQWCNLLSDPQFIKSHQTIHAHKGEEKLIYVSWYRELQTITFNHNPQNGIDIISRTLNLQQLSNSWVSVAGSCNGLVLVIKREEAKYLINPTTLEYHRIPNFDLALPVPGSCSMYGFGYDTLSDDYKVVTLSYYDSFDENDPAITETFVDIYSLRKGLWKRLESSPYDHPLSDRASGVLVNGVLHWLACKTSQYSFVIAAFHLSDEKFLEVAGPTGLGSNYSLCNLVVLRGCLCIFTSIGKDMDTVTFWMMKEYGVKESWTKFTITEPNLDRFMCTLLCSVTDDDVLLDVEEELVVYNMKENQRRDLMVDASPIMYEARTFMDSLVSPYFSQGN
ncbi:F-box/kelch-repeat protein At3g06240-like [Nicotiana tomentosiformis]|uniref:F-box/kelch-repeat protein At3g06240-like n=1 Tax=Nicotiana tomentosiformis TaxID=4098 RepID=UPI00051CA2BD|nr:F-box/kelch-repeat protein At3g06240-like [Nicotiana tomentosiformis]XP_009630556.1 F-box/kelch-repeat protein At3g06240-like [Nicotiana tomentosiformis]XP_009630557.1 F-box/kelch-repeat protein At3g06240-like [Nicotiana tomentosiformis]